MQTRQGNRSLPPLFCVPFIVKDNFDTAGMAATAGAVALLDNYPAQDAQQVGTALVSAGKPQASESPSCMSKFLPARAFAADFTSSAARKCNVHTFNSGPISAEQQPLPGSPQAVWARSTFLWMGIEEYVVLRGSSMRSLA